MDAKEYKNNIRKKKVLLFLQCKLSVYPCIVFDVQGVGDEDILLEDYQSDGEQEEDYNVRNFFFNC